MARLTIDLDLPDEHPWITQPPDELVVQAEDGDDVVFAAFTSVMAQADGQVVTYDGEVG